VDLDLKTFFLRIVLSLDL